MNINASLIEVQDTAEAYLKAAGLSQEQIERLKADGYFTAPASRRNHLARCGGLALHSINVTDGLIAMRAFKSDRSAYRVGMLHDLCKVYSYRLNGKTGEYEKRATEYPGHGAASALYAADLGIRLTDVERLSVVWHMGGFAVRDRDSNDAYDAAKLRFPREVVLTHAADHLASAMEDAEEEKAREGVQ